MATIRQARQPRCLFIWTLIFFEILIATRLQTTEARCALDGALRYNEHSLCLKPQGNCDFTFSQLWENVRLYYTRYSSKMNTGGFFEHSLIRRIGGSEVDIKSVEASCTNNNGLHTCTLPDDYCALRVDAVAKFNIRGCMNRYDVGQWNNCSPNTNSGSRPNSTTIYEAITFTQPYNRFTLYSDRNVACPPEKQLNVYAVVFRCL